MNERKKTVVVVPYDPRWVQEFAAASHEIASALGGNLCEFHHIGSTSIPGIYAKPIIDMLAVVSDHRALDQASTHMEANGYKVRGEFGITGRRYFCRNNRDGERTHQVHAFEIGSPHILRHLAFRDFMRAHKMEAEQYGNLKRTLAEAHAYDWEGYMDCKEEFIETMEQRALAWAVAGFPLSE